MCYLKGISFNSRTNDLFSPNQLLDMKTLFFYRFSSPCLEFLSTCVVQRREHKGKR